MLFYNLAVKIPELGTGTGISGPVRPQLFYDTLPFFFFTLIIVALCYLIMYIVMNSSFSKVAQGLRENEERLTFIGINIKNYKLMLIVVSSLFAGIAGVLYAMLTFGAYSPYFSIDLSTEGLMMCIVGGMFSFLGPSIGAIITVLITVWISSFTQYHTAILGIILDTRHKVLPERHTRKRQKG